MDEVPNEKMQEIERLQHIYSLLSMTDSEEPSVVNVKTYILERLENKLAEIGCILNKTTGAILLEVHALRKQYVYLLNNTVDTPHTIPLKIRAKAQILSKLESKAAEIGYSVDQATGYLSRNSVAKMGNNSIEPDETKEGSLGGRRKRTTKRNRRTQCKRRRPKRALNK
jgi:hypothetical protein